MVHNPDELDEGAVNDPFEMDDDLDLEELDNAWDDVEAASTGNVPDGTYQAKVEQVKLDKTRTTGKPILKMTFTILNGKQKGRKLFKNSQLQTKDNLKYLKADMNTMGVKLAKVSDLKKEEVLESMLDLVLEVKQTTRKTDSGEYTNVYINRKLDTTAADADFEQMSAEADKVF